MSGQQKLLGTVVGAFVVVEVCLLRIQLTSSEETRDIDNWKVIVNVLEVKLFSLK